MVKKLVSVCISAYNESECIAELATRLTAIFEALADHYAFEAIICDNGSADDTYGRLLAVHGRDARFKVVRLSRNFYAEGGLTAALAHARGDCAIIMHADLQDQPEYIPRFLEIWERGYQNVYAIVTTRSGESRFRRFFARGYYWLMNTVSDSPAPRNVSDFRLVDRTVYEVFLRMPERFRVMRFMWPWMGFRSIGIDTERPKRAGGRSNFRFISTVYGALRHVLAQSRAPLVVLPIFGMALTILSFALLIYYVTRALFFGVPFDGFGSIVSIMLLLFGFVSVFLWVIAEYVGLIFDQVRLRPVYIVWKTHGFDSEKSPPTEAYAIPSDDRTPL